MIIIVLLLLGLCLGSFVNALVWRLHEQEHSKSKKSKEALSILHGRSMCPHCKHELDAADLVPVFSWLVLKGKCRYCKKPISWQYPLVETLTAALFLFSFAYWPYGFETQGLTLFVFWLIILTGLVALLLYDIKWMELPHRITLTLSGLVVAQITIQLLFFHKGVSIIVGAILGVICLAGLFYLLLEVSKGKWIGGGDVVLGVVLGLLVGGPAKALLLLFLASLIGSTSSLPGVLTKKLSTTSKVPFGPFLIIAGIIVYLFGTGMINWYRSKLLSL